MEPRKLVVLRCLLLLSASYFLIAAFAHFFGWTIFPMYDGRLYAPYHDTLLALCDLIFVMLFLVVAKDPVKNIDTLNVILASFALVIIFNAGIIWKIDFMLLGSTEKQFQTIIETILAAIMLISLIIVKPKDRKQ